MKGLFYFRLHFDDREKLGVVTKCKAIASAFRQHGHSTEVWHYTRDGFMSDAKPTASLPFRAKPKSLRHIFLYYILSDFWLWRQVDFKQFDYLYIRHLPTHPMFIWLLSRIKKQHPDLKIILEMATFPYDREYTGLKNKLILTIDRLCRRCFKYFIDKVAHYGDDPTILGIPTITIQNGIVVRDIAQRKISPASHNTLHLLAVGNWSKWHALDRLLLGMAAHRTKHKQLPIQLTIIGHGPAKPQLVELVAQLELTDFVHFKEPMDHHQLEPYFEKSHLAIGSLGIHRIDLAKAVPLKHREYCARGIPFIFSSHDDDFSSNLPFALQVNADDTPINIAELLDFARRCYKDHATSQAHMRSFAAARLDWSAKMKPILLELGNT